MVRELRAMNDAWLALKGLDDKAIFRALDWLEARMISEKIGRLKNKKKGFEFEPKRSKNNKTGYLGVFEREDQPGYSAEITVRGIHFWIYYIEIEDAVKERYLMERMTLDELLECERYSNNA